MEDLASLISEHLLREKFERNWAFLLICAHEISQHFLTENRIISFCDIEIWKMGCCLGDTYLDKFEHGDLKIF